MYSCLNVLVSALVSPVGNGAEKSKWDASFRWINWYPQAHGYWARLFFEPSNYLSQLLSVLSALYMYLYFQWIFSIHLNIEIHFDSCNCFTKFIAIFSFLFYIFTPTKVRKCLWWGMKYKGTGLWTLGHCWFLISF